MSRGQQSPYCPSLNFQLSNISTSARPSASTRMLGESARLVATLLPETRKARPVGTRLNTLIISTPATHVKKTLVIADETKVTKPSRLATLNSDRIRPRRPPPLHHRVHDQSRVPRRHAPHGHRVRLHTAPLRADYALRRIPRLSRRLQAVLGRHRRRYRLQSRLRTRLRDRIPRRPSAGRALRALHHAERPRPRTRRPILPPPRRLGDLHRTPPACHPHLHRPAGRHREDAPRPLSPLHLSRLMAVVPRPRVRRPQTRGTLGHARQILPPLRRRYRDGHHRRDRVVHLVGLAQPCARRGVKLKPRYPPPSQP